MQRYIKKRFLWLGSCQRKKHSSHIHPIVVVSSLSLRGCNERGKKAAPPLALFIKRVTRSEKTAIRCHIHCIHLQFRSYLSPDDGGQKNKLRKNVRDFYHSLPPTASALCIALFSLDDAGARVIYSLKRYRSPLGALFITNFQGNFQHHPIFIIVIFPPPLLDWCRKKTFLHPHRFFCAQKGC